MKKQSRQINTSHTHIRSTSLTSVTASFFRLRHLRYAYGSSNLLGFKKGALWMHPQLHRYDGDPLLSSPLRHNLSFICPRRGVQRRLNKASRFEHIPSVQLGCGDINKRKVRRAPFLHILTPFATYGPLDWTFVH